MVRQSQKSKSETSTTENNNKLQNNGNTNDSRKRSAVESKSTADATKRPKVKTKDAILDAVDIPTGVLMVVGMGDMGQLGLGDEVMTRKKPAVVSSLSEKKISLVAAGGIHTCCLTSENEIYTFGCNDEAALGRVAGDSDEEYIPAPIVGPLSRKKIQLLSAGDSHTAAVTMDGEPFVWGCFRDSHGRLGLLHAGRVCEEPTQLTSIHEQIIDIASGTDHVVMLSASNRVFTLGCAEQGQLGRISRYFSDRTSRVRSRVDNEKTENNGKRRKGSMLFPQPVTIPKVKRKRPEIVKVFCGAYSNWALSSDGDVFAWGLNNYNQLGFADGEMRFSVEHVPKLSQQGITHVAAGDHHALFLNDKGRVLVLGRGCYGRLGLGPDVKQADQLLEIPDLSDVTAISAKDAVSFAVTKHGDAYAWGFGTNLQLTTGSEDDEWRPVKLTGKQLERRKVLRVSCGSQHTVLVATPADHEKDENGIE